MIKHVKCEGLNGGVNVDADFHSDMNVVVGKNGSGKTTFLKLLWYCLSGNIERVVREVTVDFFRIESDQFWIEMTSERQNKQVIASFRYDAGSGEKTVKTQRSEDIRIAQRNFQILNRDVMRAASASLFFPTFRRIEGGFSIQQDDSRLYRTAESAAFITRSDSSLASAMNDLSARLTNGKHHFVSSISTLDVVSLLTNRYADISEKTNRLHTDLSHFILQTPIEVSDADTSTLLADIRREADKVKQESESLLRPFTVLSLLIEKIFTYRGIKMANTITLGEVTEAISSHILSAGEKQMLSFLCYNAFATGSCIFIDEPEISLHVDWQRILFPTLMSQSTGNQFIIATHSPFIYSKYSDKEIVLNDNRGDCDADSTAD